ncbi:MAG TPA: FeoA family protein [Victivallales bacterium]|nr:FeoA family protein [Victivallales bacterium]
MKNILHKNEKKLSEVQPGSTWIVVSLEGGKGFITRLSEMGIRKDLTLEVISNSGGPVFVKCGESRFAIGHDMSKKIIVRKMM